MRRRRQAFEGGCFNHLYRLLDRSTPDFLALSCCQLIIESHKV